MGMQGNLQDMAIADLIQQNCQDFKTVKLTIDHSGQQASLYFEGGNIVHAALGTKTGEDVIYEILEWKDGLFDVVVGDRAMTRSITRSWSGLLMEGARRLDENELKPGLIQTQPDTPSETHKVINLDDVLKGINAEVAGYIGSSLVGLDGLVLASNTSSNVMDQEVIGAQLTILFKLVDTSVQKLAAGEVEDNLITTENAYLLMRFLPGKLYYLSLIANRKSGSLGNMRLISKIYAERLSKAIAR
jgi:predicted regulator of Ras-like GTPase activity (Roadblock/LC7/MglB family)